MKQNRFPPGWDEQRVQRVLEHYESKTEDEAVMEDEAAFANPGATMMPIPHKLVPKDARVADPPRAKTSGGTRCRSPARWSG